MDTGSAGATLSIAGVVAGNALIAQVVAHRAGTPSGNLIAGIGSRIGGSPANTWQLAVRESYVSGAGAMTEVTIWYALNVAAGDTSIELDFQYEDDSTFCRWGVDEWAGILTSGALDKTASSEVGPNSASITVTGTTLAQAAELVIGAVGNKWNFSWNGSASGAGAAPAGGYTVLRGDTDNAVMSFQAAYKEVSATTAPTITWDQVNDADQGCVAALATFRIGTINRRIRVAFDAAINGATGITAYAWRGLLESVLPKKYTGLTAEASGGVLLIPVAAGDYTTGESVSVIAYQPSGTGGCTLTTGTVEEY